MFDNAWYKFYTDNVMNCQFVLDYSLYPIMIMLKWFFFPEKKSEEYPVND